MPITQNNNFSNNQHHQPWLGWVINVFAALVLPILAPWALFRLAKAIKLKQKAMAILSLFMLLAAIAGSIIYWRLFYYPSHQRADTEYKYSYQQLDDYKLGCTDKGRSISFKKPVEFTKPKAYNPGDTRQIELYDLPTRLHKDVNENVVPFGSIKATCLADPSAADKNYLKSLAQVLGDTAGLSYETYTKPLHEFIQSTFYGTYNTFDFTPPQPFTNQNIKDNAWRLEFIAHKGKTQPAEQKIPTKKGVLIYAARDGIYYFFIINDVEINWQSNQKVWDQVINSVKLDQ